MAAIMEALQGVLDGASTMQLAALASVATLVTLVVLRLAQNMMPSGKPPILEGIPYVGGLLKFSKVRTMGLHGALAITHCAVNPCNMKLVTCAP